MGGISHPYSERARRHSRSKRSTARHLLERAASCVSLSALRSRRRPSIQCNLLLPAPPRILWCLLHASCAGYYWPPLATAGQEQASLAIAGYACIGTTSLAIYMLCHSPVACDRAQASEASLRLAYSKVAVRS